MALFKIFKRKKRRKSKSKKQFSVGRFCKALLASTVTSFLVSSWLLNPQLFNKDNFVPTENIVVERLGHITLDSVDWSIFSSLLPSVDSISPIQWVSSALADRQQPSRQNHISSGSDYTQTRFTQCPQFFPHGHLPIVPTSIKQRELCFTPFAILHNGDTKTPIFVAQRLNRQMLLAAQKISRTDRFYEEGRLPRSERAALDDYQGSGFDRGHMAPAGDMHNEEAMAQSFSLANIVPQNSQHNRGAWSKIESDTRKYILRAKGDVFVFTGPVYDEQPSTIGAQKVAIPKYLFKLVYDATTKKAWVHWHENSSATRVGPPISYAEFVQRTGLHLLDPNELVN